MSASKLKQRSINPSSKESSSSTTSAYTAYNAVDELVAKPVFGSDGAKKWQSFAQSTLKQQQHIHSKSVAPTAPLKAIDRATGFTSWKEEREYSNQIRQSDDKNTTSSGYTNFTQKGNHQNNNELSSKERKRIERRIIGENQEYFIPSSTFVGWKFDYVFTTRMETHGTGYYFDGMDSIKLLRGQISKDNIPSSAKVMTLVPSEAGTETKRRLAGDNTDTAATASSDIGATTPISKKKKKIKNLPPVIVNNPNHPLEQIAAILAQRQQQQQQPTSSELLPMGWECAKDTVTGKQYYFNRTTGERTWELPKSIINDSSKTETTTGISNYNEKLTHSCWNVTKDPTSGKEYYYNSQTGETSWEKPTAFTTSAT
jgi:hypothetical protein